MPVRCPWQGKPDGWRRMWPVWGAGGGYYIVLRTELRPCEEPLPLGTAEAVLERMVGDLSLRSTVMELYNAVRGPALGPRTHLNDAAVRHSIHTRLRQAFQRQELCLCRVEPLMGIGGALEEQAAPPPAATPLRESGKKTWIEVRLVDMEGNPVPNKHYLIKTPSGQVEEGFLDASGHVRLNNVDPGTCSISFPDLDREAWEWA